MAKKDRKNRQQPVPEPETPAASAGDTMRHGVPVPSADEPAAPEKPVPSGIVLLFWVFIAVLLFGAWAAESFTLVSEAKLERWLMLPLALFCVLILFLTRKKKDPDVPEV
ncbi:MAG TPA: hypothetical protein PK523_09260 [Elusimicrobiales bacterium]|nr:hypothetical protein [Elusimicrobiales bacterium]